jgi:cytochrome b561
MNTLFPLAATDKGDPRRRAMERLGKQSGNRLGNAVSYSLIRRFNHWLGALLILILLAIGLYFDEMPHGDERLHWLRLHVAIGALSLAFLGFRIFWSLHEIGPIALPQPPLLSRARRLIHALLLSAVTVLILTGPLVVWTAGRPIEVFDWFSLASPVGPMHQLHLSLTAIHAFAGKVVLIALVLHLAGAAGFFIADRQRLIQRMFSPGQAAVDDRSRYADLRWPKIGHW